MYPSVNQLPELLRILRIWSHIIGDPDAKVEFGHAPSDGSWVCTVRVRMRKDNAHQMSMSGTVEHAISELRESARHELGSNFEF